ncbi:hypothetical protein [Bradyrhizobium tropiciagri]|nr:hypothetical protein [Bradyrhizobium tropiciagri]
MDETADARSPAELDVRAIAALDNARALPPVAARKEAMKLAGALR